jgi:hypothetical protein
MLHQHLPNSSGIQSRQMYLEYNINRTVSFLFIFLRNKKSVGTYMLAFVCGNYFCASQLSKSMQTNRFLDNSIPHCCSLHLV